MNTVKLLGEIARAVAREIDASRRRPVAVYRLQFNSSFTFQDATRLVPYLHKLGITDCYASPFLRSRTGSRHGYDISDHNTLNPEIGNEKDYQKFVEQLHKYGIGQILDFVPNHMGIFDNPKFLDVLENGPSSIYARFFDIDWDPVGKELQEKVLLPILEDLYGNVLEKGHLRLDFQQGAFSINYYEHQLPVGPKTTITILEPSLEGLKETLGDSDADFLEMQSIVTACRNLPERSDIQQERMAERHREIEIIKRRLAEVCAKNETIKTKIDEAVASFNGTPGDNASFSKLHELLEKQAYRLSYWRVAADEINYRRFFDVNELIALHMEDPSVFEETHRFLRRLLDENVLNGVRLDHVDGLFDPEDYLWRFQKSRWLDLVRKKMTQNPKLSLADSAAFEEKLTEWFERERASNPDSPKLRPIFMVVEKILGEKENLRETWPVDGTTGYEFAASLNQIFIDKKHQRTILDTYQKFTRINSSFRDLVYDCKSLVMETTMSAEINLLAHELKKVSERSWNYRDFTLNNLSDAIREVIACFPVYRTYINAYRESVDNRDKKVIDNAVLEAKRRNPAMSSAIFDFVRNTLLLDYPGGMDEAGRKEQQFFVMRFQQFTSPVMAKGVEDTAFYIYNPLVSVCDVGGCAERLGTPVQEFHRQNMQRHRTKPYSFIATSTHDSKRGEDVRARINVLSEVPGEWKSALTRWSRINKNRKKAIDGESVPDRNEEYLLYQTLLGTYPTHEMDDKESSEYKGRIQDYMLKAIREAKVHTSWISPNASYEDGVTGFVSDVLEPSPANRFLIDFLELNKMVASCGLFNSLSQVVLKILSPGVPDIYQGNELWSFNLTDPDNRRPVDFALRADKLKSISGVENDLRNVKKLMDNRENGDIKLYVTHKTLSYRRENAQLFENGTYTPLKAEGPKKKYICAFTWKKGRKQVTVVVPRLVAGLTRNTTIMPLGDDAWGDTRLLLPKLHQSNEFRNILTAEVLNGVPGNDRMELKLAEIFTVLPLAVLETVH